MADNIILFAADYAMMQKMIDNLINAFTDCGADHDECYFKFKTDSLEYMASGSLKQDGHPATPLVIHNKNGEDQPYLFQDQIKLLGENLAYDGSTIVSVHSNLARAEGHYFKHQQVLRNSTLPTSWQADAFLELFIWGHCCVWQ